MITFFQPWAFAFAGLLPVIVLLYLLKVKRRTLPVSTLLFWQHVLQERGRRAPWQKLRQLFSLLLHLLIFALVLLALARPLLSHVVQSSASTVLVLDVRARMSATEPGGQTRFALAAEQARRWIRQAGAWRQMALISAGAESEVVVPFTGDEKALRDGLERVSATDAGGSLDAAIALGREILASRAGEKRLIVWSDRPGQDTISTATPGDNVGIVRFAARYLPGQTESAEALLTVKNFGRNAVDTEVGLTLGTQKLDHIALHLASGEAITRSLPLVIRASHPPRADDGHLTARLVKGDRLAADDVAYAALPLRPALRVLLVSGGNWFLEKLLAAEAGIKFELISPANFRPEVAAGFDAILLDDFLPSGFSLEKTVGNLLLLGSAPFPSSEPLAQPIVTDQDAAHPLLRAVHLEHVSFHRAASWPEPVETAGWRFSVPLRYAEHPLLVAGTRRTGSGTEQRLAALAFRLSDSDLPLRVAFPLLISNAIHWLAGDDASAVREARAGEQVTLAEGEILALPEPASGSVRATKNGIYEIKNTSRPSAWLAVNTADPDESDLSSAVSAPGAPASTWLWPAVSGWPLWQILTLAAGLLFLGEWWLFHRRRTE